MSQVVNATGFVGDAWQDMPVPNLSDYAGGSALLLAVDEDAAQIAPHFNRLKLIVIPFAKSADGRGFSQAALLRALGFEGHIRARGHVLVDQFRAALRAGFDDIEISATQATRNPEHQWRAVSLSPGYHARLFV